MDSHELRVLDKQHAYTLSMDYSTIHNIESKTQKHTLRQPSGKKITQKKTTYDWTYRYDGPQPHAPTHLGERTFSYDANGNQLGWTHDKNGTRRSITWDEENRIQAIEDNGHTMTYTYDASGQRITKRGPQGETAYINQWFTLRNGEVGAKHVFAGTSRVVSKLVKQDKPNSKRKGKIVYEKDQYYYHPDHLGTTAYITHTNGQVYQHLEYFPFGETWVEEHSNKQRTPYLFTAKELDEETGLYYFGARYYDPRTSVWQSADPMLAKYMAGKSNGGVYTSFNLGSYSYGYQNPLKFFDPDGNDVYLVVWATQEGRIGHAGIAVTQYAESSSGDMVETDGVRYRDLWPGSPVGRDNVHENVEASYGDATVTEKSLITKDVTGSEGYPADGVIRIDTDFSTDKLVEKALDKFEENNPYYNGIRCNCSDYAETGIESALGIQLDSDESVAGEKVTTPNKLFRSLKGLDSAEILKNPGDKVSGDFLESVTGSKVKAKAGDKMLQDRLDSQQ